MKSKTEIEALICELSTTEVTRFPGMTYEQGIDIALRWVLDEEEDYPLT